MSCHLKDFSSNRGNLKRNFLKNIILKVDFDDIVELESTTEKRLKSYLRTEGFNQQAEGAIDALSFAIKLSEANKISIDNTERRQVLVFNNVEKKIRFEISPFFVIIIQYDGFDTYTSLDELKGLFISVLKILKETECGIFFNRLGIRKINAIRDDQELLKTYFKPFLITEIDPNSCPIDAQSDKTRIDKFYQLNLDGYEPTLKNIYHLEFKTQLTNGYSYNKDKESKTKMTQFIFDFDVYYNNSSLLNDKEPDDIDYWITDMNTVLFNFFMNIFTEEAIGNKLIKEYTHE